MLFKILDTEGKSCNGGDMQWSLPQDGKPGRWHTVKGELELCVRGLHLVPVHRIFDWYAPGRRIFLAEPKGPIVYDGGKLATKKARLVQEITPDYYLLPLYPILKVFIGEKNLTGADLKGADLRGADLRGADLRGAYLTGADLMGAYLRGADLRGSFLTGADLRGADLRGADLRGAYLTGADLTGADLRGAYPPIDPPAGWRVNEAGRLEREEISGSDRRSRRVSPFPP